MDLTMKTPRTRCLALSTGDLYSIRRCSRGRVAISSTTSFLCQPAHEFDGESVASIAEPAMLKIGS